MCTGYLFLDPTRQPPKPRPLSRSCADNAALWIGTCASIATVLFGIYALLFDNNVSQWPLAVVVTAGVVGLLVHPCGEISLGANWPVVSYTYFVLLLGATMLLLWLVVMNLVFTSQGTLYIEENWFLLQNTVLIPFTTQLDQKKLFSQNQSILFGLGLVLSLSRLVAVQDVWKALGGTPRLVRGRFGLLAPAMLVLVPLAVATLVYDDLASDIVPWAIPYNIDALLAQSAASGCVLIALGLVAIATAAWGSSVIAHVLGALLLAPCALVSFLTGVVTLHRSTLIASFVASNWAQIIQFVPAQFAAQPYEKYSTAAYGPTAAAGACGLILSLCLAAAVALHVRAAQVILALGPALDRLAGPAFVEAASAAVGAGGLGFALSSKAAEGGGADAATYQALGGAAGKGLIESEEAGDEEARGASGGGGGSRAGVSVFPARPTENSFSALGGGGTDGAPLSSSSSVSRPASYRDAPSAAELQSETAAVAKGARKGAGYGSAAGSVDGGSSVVSGSGGGSDSLYTVPLSSPARTAAAATGGGISSVAASSSAPPAAPANVFGLPPDQYDAAIAQARSAYARYLYAKGLSDKTGPAVYANYPEAEMGARMAAPGFSTLWGAFRGDVAHVWGAVGAGRAVVLASAAAVVAAIAGMSYALSVVAADAQCGSLARAPASVTYSTVFPIAVGNMLKLTNSFPFGSIEYAATTQSIFYPSPVSHNVSVEVTYYATAAGSLPSYDFFLGHFNETEDPGKRNPITGSDDNINGDGSGGYWFSTITMLPPPNAGADCVAARVRVVSGITYAQVMLRSDNLLINVTGNFDEASQGLAQAVPAPLPPTLLDLDVATVSGSIVVASAFLDIPPFNFNYPPLDYNDVPTHLALASQTGDISVTFSSAPGIAITTGGTIRTSNLFSSALLSEYFSSGNVVVGIGNLAITATGDGRVACSQGLSANNIQVTTQHGVLVMANAGVILGRRMDIASTDGKIYLSNLLAASGNETYVSTANDISISAGFSNRFMISATGAGKVSVFEAFMGTPKSALILPALEPGQNYSDPLLSITTERGAISVLGLGGNPASVGYSDILSAFITSDLGAIKIEVNGGGLNGNYSLSSAKGTAITELDGRESPNTGVLGEGSSGRNQIVVHSNAGDVQLTLLASPL